MHLHSVQCIVLEKPLTAWNLFSIAGKSGTLPLTLMLIHASGVASSI